MAETFAEKRRRPTSPYSHGNLLKKWLIDCSTEVL